jgi:RHS repeat-associated protein
VDPLDRPVRVVETHSGSSTSTDLVYVGLSTLVGKETLSGAASAVKSYWFDPFGGRVGLSDAGGRFSLVNDPHGSASLVLDQASLVRESYAYTAYGTTVAALSKTSAGFNPVNAPVRNPYRYSGKRLVTGLGSAGSSSAYDMGARTYEAATGRFLQRDHYFHALANLSLSQDPLTSNRYALAAGNPITYVELDGHFVVLDDAKAAVYACGANPRYCGEASLGGGGDPVLEAIVSPAGKAKLAAGVAGTVVSGARKAGTALFCRWFCPNAAKTGTAVVPKAPVALGRWGEARLAAELGGAGIKPRSPFSTSLGKRYVDRLVDGVAYEAKAGVNVGLTSAVRRQALKDAELIASGRIRAAEWHFFQGAQPELMAFLRRNGIRPVVHP